MFHTLSIHFLCLFLFTLVACTNGFIVRRFTTKMNKRVIENNVIENAVIKKINGFYGLVGPNINMSAVGSLFELFTGDGIVQGVFFDNGNVTFVKHVIQTEKILFEENMRRFFPMPISMPMPFKMSNPLITTLYMILHGMGLVPNMMGVANTALLQTKHKVLALFERDLPYLLNVNFENKTVNTIGKLRPLDKSLIHFSGHTKYRGELETIQYNIFTKKVFYFRMRENLEVIFKTIVKMRYVPIVHDFYSNNNIIIIADSPIIMNATAMFSMKMPTVLDNKRPTFLNVVNKETGYTDIYMSKKGFFIFHYSKVIEKTDTIEVYACVYEEMDFMNVSIKGTYCKLVLDRKSKTIDIVRNPVLEYYNLDFPIAIDDKRTILRNIKEQRINGFVLVENLKVKQELLFSELSIMGEPAITHVEGVPYLMCFALENNIHSVLLIINMDNFTQIKIPIDFCSDTSNKAIHDKNIGIGFHSIFIPRE